MLTKLVLTPEEASFAADALGAIVKRWDRPWIPERTHAYSSLERELRAPQDGDVTILLTESQLANFAFALVNADRNDPRHIELLAKLKRTHAIPPGSLTVDELVDMQGSPVFVHAHKAYGLVFLKPESRQHEDAPWLQCIDGKYDIVMRGLVCTPYETAG